MLNAHNRQFGMRSAVLVPMNVYGPDDNCDPQTTHVIPALIRKCEEARLRGDQEIVCWGTGKATREFLSVDNAAEGIVRAAEVLEVLTPINLGGGEKTAITGLVRMIADTCGFTGSIRWGDTKPDGQPRRALDTSRARQALGWHAKTSFSDALRAPVEWGRARLHRTAKPSDQPCYLRVLRSLSRVIAQSLLGRNNDGHIRLLVRKKMPPRLPLARKITFCSFRM